MKNFQQDLFSVSNLLNNERDRYLNQSWGWMGKSLYAKEKPLLCNESCCFANEVCQNSNLHGLKYVGNIPGRYFERIFFGIFFTLGIVASVILIMNAFQKYRDFPTFVTFRENDVRIDSVPFPSITICNINNVSKKKAMAIIDEAANADYDMPPETEDKLYFLDHICQTTTTSFTSKYLPTDGSPADMIDVRFESDGEDEYVPPNPYVLEQQIFNATQSCEEMIKLCLWQNKQVNCSELFYPILTDYGSCCAFNMAPAPLLFNNTKLSTDIPEEFVAEWNKTELTMESLLTPPDTAQTQANQRPRRVKRSGLYHGLSILLDPDIGDYFCPSADSLGFQLSAHVPIEYPQLAEFGEGIAPSTENFIKVSPDVTTADPEIRSLAPEDRNCYFAGEQELQYFTKYTLRNCLDECLAAFIYEYCNCTRFYMPKDDNRTLCGHAGVECAVDTMSQLVTNQWIIHDYCRWCRPTCTSVSYDIEVTSRHIREDLNVWAEDVNDMKNIDDKKYSIVHIYFAEDSTYPKVRKRLFGTIDIIANVGGLLGLCLGFSILSGVELLYMLIVRVFGKSCIVARMLLRRRINNGYRMQTSVYPSNNNPVVKRKLVRNESRRIITTQPLSTAAMYPATYGYGNALPSYFLDEVAPRFATGNNLRYY